MSEKERARNVDREIKEMKLEIQLKTIIHLKIYVISLYCL